MIARLFIVALLAFGLAGCAEISAFYTVVEAKAAGTADKHLKASKKVYCNTQTSGAMFRNMYGTAEWKRFKDACWHGKQPFPKTPGPPSAPDS